MDDFVEEKTGKVLRRLQAATDKLKLVGDEVEDIGPLVSKTRALMHTNEEIWERCKPSQITRLAERPGGEQQLRLYRVGYPKLSVTSSASGASNRSVLVSTASELEIQSFEPLPLMSEELIGFFHIESISDSDCSPIRYNYEDCLTSILCTKDNIARQFLIILKAHLEQEQIALGKMERWLLDVGEWIQFINQTFNSNLSQPELGNGNNSARGGICVKCFEPYANHDHDLYTSWCPVAGDERQQGSYFVSASHDLKKINIASPFDTYTLTFHTCIADDRERLQRFLHLMAAPGTSPPPPPPVTHVNTPVINTTFYVDAWESDSS